LLAVFFSSYIDSGALRIGAGCGASKRRARPPTAPPRRHRRRTRAPFLPMMIGGASVLHIAAPRRGNLAFLRKSKATNLSLSLASGIVEDRAQAVSGAPPQVMVDLANAARTAPAAPRATHQHVLTQHLLDPHALGLIFLYAWCRRRAETAACACRGRAFGRERRWGRFMGGSQAGSRKRS